LNDARPAGESGQLEVRITRKAYLAVSGERVDVLRDVAFTLGQSEVGALVGPSGCGKTTMLRIIAGLDSDFEGAIRRPPALGMVFQEPRLLPWRTVEQNVRLIRPDIDDAELASLFDVLELSAHRAHYPGELSLGLARRVALARAFAVDPALLLLDEPFVSLDEALAVRLREELVTLVETRETTTLLVTHDIEEAVRLADRVFLLAGRPARIVAEIGFATPRRARTEADIAGMMAQVASRQNGRPAAG
jgi:ABC-type nitrate/sulfonate/bicarbonate transport system ATPase subunit